MNIYMKIYVIRMHLYICKCIDMDVYGHIYMNAFVQIGISICIYIHMYVSRHMFICSISICIHRDINV
jgi:hypothetical protein